MPKIPGVFSSNRLKVQLRLAVNRLKLMQQKKASLNASQRKEIATLLEHGKTESARVRVEHIIREDFTMEALEVLELYCELLLARFGLLEVAGPCDSAIQEAVHTLIYAAPRSEVKELHLVRDQLGLKYGKDFMLSAIENRGDLVNRRVIQKLKVQTPESYLVTQYLKEIAKAYSVAWEADEDDEDDDDGSAGIRLGKEKDVRSDPSGRYNMYDASQTGFTPSRDYPVNPAAPRARQPSAPSGGEGPPPHQRQPMPGPLPAMSPPMHGSGTAVGAMGGESGPPHQFCPPTHYMDGTPIPIPPPGYVVSGMPHSYMPSPGHGAAVPGGASSAGWPPGYGSAMSFGKPGGGGERGPPPAMRHGLSSASSTTMAMPMPIPMKVEMPSHLGGGEPSPSQTDVFHASSPNKELDSSGLEKREKETAGEEVGSEAVPSDLDFPSIPGAAPAASATSVTLSTPGADPSAPDRMGDHDSGAGDANFDELARRFEALKRRK